MFLCSLFPILTVKCLFLCKAHWVDSGYEMYDINKADYNLSDDLWINISTYTSECEESACHVCINIPLYYSIYSGFPVPFKSR